LGIDSTLNPDEVFRVISGWATPGAITLSAAAIAAGTPNKLAMNRYISRTEL
jgi:hypothetical protein